MCSLTDTLLFAIYLIINIITDYRRRKHIDYEAIKFLMTACQDRKIVILYLSRFSFASTQKVNFLRNDSISLSFWIACSTKLLSGFSHKQTSILYKKGCKQSLIFHWKYSKPTCKRRNSFSSSPADSPNNERPCISFYKSKSIAS